MITRSFTSDMGALNVQAPENLLLRWPSISQLDDFLFGGLGERNQLEHMAQSMGVVDRYSYEDMDMDMDTVDSMMFSMEMPLLTDVATPDQTSNMGNFIIQSSQLEPCILNESSKTTRWDSLNGLDFENILYSGFECEITSPVIYSQPLQCSEQDCSFSGDDLIPVQSDKVLFSNMDIFTAEPVYEGNNSTVACGSSDLQSTHEKTAGNNEKLLSARQKEVHEKESIPGHSFEMARGRGTENSIGPPSLGEQGIDGVSLEPLLSSPSHFTTFDTSGELSFQSVKRKFNGFQANIESGNDKNQPLTSKGSHYLSLNNQIMTTVGKVMIDAAQQPESCITQHTNIPKFASKGGDYLDEGKSCSFEGTTVSSSTQRKLGGLPLARKDKISQAQANRARRLAAKDRRTEIRAKKLLSLQAAAQTTFRSPKQSVCCIAGNALPSNAHRILPTCHSSHQFSGVGPAMPVHPNMGVAQPLWSIQSQQYIQPTFRQTSPSESLVESEQATSFQLQQLYPLNRNRVHLVPNDASCKQEVKTELKMCNQPCESLLTQEANLLQNQSILKTFTNFCNQQGSVQRGVDQPHFQQQLCTSNQSPHVDCQSPVSSCSTSKISLAKDLEANYSLESTVLQQFERTVKELSIETRLIIRDALFRLAKSAKKRHEDVNCRTCDFDVATSSSSSLSSAAVSMMETKTNPIDRCVADLLFLKHSAIP
eukprot:c27546_g1_i1 orf=114-2237(+)